MEHYCEKCFKKIKGTYDHAKWCPYYPEKVDVPDMFGEKFGEKFGDKK